MIRKILQKEDPALHKVCHPVTSFDRKLGALLDDLTATLKDAQGLGLAAPQIGILRRVCVVMDEDEQYLELVNPVIVSQEGKSVAYAATLPSAREARISSEFTSSPRAKLRMRTPSFILPIDSAFIIFLVLSLHGMCRVR